MAKWKALIIIGLILAMSVSTAYAFGAYPHYYPGNQAGHQARFYSGPWGEQMVYGGHGYFPNWNGNPPYGFRRYGSMYTPWQLRTGATGAPKGK